MAFPFCELSQDSPLMGAGARVGVGMLRNGGIPENKQNQSFDFFKVDLDPDPISGLGPATGPLTQATGPPRSGGGVAMGMLRGNPVLTG